MPEESSRKVARAIRETAHAASYLASEAASLARAFEAYQAHDESVAASRAAIRAAESAFGLDEIMLTRETDSPARERRAFDLAKVALAAASDAVLAAKHAVEKAQAASGVPDETGVGAS